MATYEKDERIDDALRSGPEAHDQPDADGERGEGRSTDASLAGCLVFGAVIIFPALIYFGFFGAVLVDELVLETHWFADVIPEPALEVLRVIYMPLIWLMDQFDG